MADATVFVNGNVVTMDPRAPAASVLVARDGRIEAVGDAGLELRHPDADTVDLVGRTLVPGFIDAHHHLCFAALHPLWADLGGVADLDTVQQRLAEAAGREPNAPWIRAAGWDEFGTGLQISRDDLDAMGLDRPVLVGCFSYHRGVVCSAGLDALELTATTPDPPGGRIERDASGRPSGLLVEAAWTAAHSASLEGFTDPDRWAEHIEARSRSLLAEGITAVHDAACPPEAEDVYRALAAAGRLPLSVLIMPHGPILAGPALDRLDRGPATGEGDELLRVGPAKVFADGGIEIAIDAHLGGEPLRSGALFPDHAAQIRAAVQRGYGVAVHAMGNAGLQAALEAWQQATARTEPEHPCRIEHVTLAGSAEVRTMRELGVGGVIQPGFVELIGRTIGDLRFDDATWLPFADLLDASITLGASSDAPCHLTDPMLCAQHGSTRLTAAGQTVGVDQAVAMSEWLRLYTAGAADIGGQGDERGRLRAGLRADLVVLDGSIFTVPVADAPPLRVDETWVAGERVSTRR